MQKITLDPSIAAEVNINSVCRHEDLNVYFTASEQWSGSYECKIYNSVHKTAQQKIPNPLTVAGTVITFKIAPSLQDLNAGTYYYEIWHVNSKRIYFKGQLNITR